MAASRRGSVTRDPQWGEADRIRNRYEHREREPRRRSPSTERATRQDSDGAPSRRGRAYLVDYKGQGARRDSPRRGYDLDKRRRSRSRHRSPHPAHREHRDSAEQGHEARRSGFKRERSRARSATPTRRKRQRTASPEAKLDPGRRRQFSRDSQRLELFPESIRANRDRPDTRGERSIRQGRSRRSRSSSRETRIEPPSRREHRSSQPPRSSDRERRPDPRWTQYEVDEYYYNRGHEGRRESPRSRRREHHHHESREPSRDWSRDRRRPVGREYDSTHQTEIRTDSSHRRHSDSPRRPRRDSMEGTRPIQSVMDEREPRGQKIPSFEGSSRGRGRGRGGFDNPRGRGGFHHAHNHTSPPPIDTRHQYAANAHYATPAGSYHNSPHSASPYSQHTGWQTPQQYYSAPAHAYAAAPQPRQSSYPPQQPPTYYQPHPHQYSPQAQTPTFAPAYRGGHAPARGNSYPPPQDRRFPGGSVAGSPPQQSPQVSSRGGRGHFQNLRWTASGGTQGGKPPETNGPSIAQGSREQSVQSTAPPPPPPAPKEPAPPPPEEDNPFRPSKAFRVEDDSSANPVPEPDSPLTQKKTGFSFAFKGKAALPTPAKPVTDLTQKMKEPPIGPRRDSDVPRKTSSLSSRDGPSSLPPKPGSERRQEPADSRDPRDRYAEQRREREAEAERYKQERLAQQKRGTREPEKPKPKPKPGVVKMKEKRKRMKPRPQLEPELKSSKSVYFRKQGNESVVGSGTYGKVYKAVHVYTGALVALKKIRMEGEKDGFPVTAVREIKLLQSLRHDNVVRLQEVMVENNDCYMVFEYLSHDLTGLLNHPTFKLDHAHKKHLAMQLFQSLDYLHRRGVLHRDLKAANILVSSKGQLKLADFGLARFYSKHHTLDYTNRVITIWYRPPELLLGETQYGPAVDIWSAACVLIEIFTKHAIFPGDGGEINQLEKIYNVLGTPTRMDWPGLADMAWFELLRPAERRSNIFKDKYAERVSSQAFNLLKSMFQYDPKKRPSAETVLAHPYFKSEEPAPQQVTELENVDGDWHEFESKALRKENERRARKAAEAERDKEKAKRRASSHAAERDTKRVKGDEVDEQD